MADNPTIDNGNLTDYVASADEGGSGAFVQRVKLTYAANGSEVHVPADADGLLVNLGAHNDVTVASGTVEATQGGAWNVTNVSGTVSLPTGASTLGEQQTQTSALGPVTESVPGTDTASSGINGRLQRLAQRLTTIIGLLPTSLGVGGGLKVDGSGTALPVSLASVPSHAVTNAGTFAVQSAASQAGTWTVQPGNTANTTAWKVDGSAVTQPISGTITANAGTGTMAVSVASLPSHAVTNAGTFAVQISSISPGTNAIGKLAANSGVDIGDVDVTSIGSGSNVIGRVGHDTTGIGDGRKVVSSAGTRVALASTTVAKSVVITAETDNTGTVVVGAAATVVAALSTRRGTPLSAGDTISLPCDDLADIGLDSTVSGDGVTFVYLT